MGRKNLFSVAGVLGLVWLAGCAPSVAAVPNISTGATGCPVSEMVAFNYHRGNRTWNAACGDQQFVCSARGGVRCTKQQSDTLDAEAAIRAKALRELSVERRRWFVNKDITQGSWREFALMVATVQAMTEEQLEMMDPRRVFTGWSKALEAPLKECARGAKLAVYVEQSGTLNTLSGGCRAVLDSEELQPLRTHHGKTFYLVPGLSDIQPVARPTLSEAPVDALAAAPAETAAVETPAASAPAEGSKELEQAVRAWLDSERAAILACTGKEQSALQVKIEAERRLQITLRGAAPGSPEEGCVQSALAKVPELPPGTATVVHLVRN